MMISRGIWVRQSLGCRSERSEGDKIMKSEGDQGSNARTFILRKSEMKSDWNLVKITRRGVNVSSEFVRIRQSFSGLHLIVQ